MIPEVWLWVGFNAFVLAMLALDLGVFHRHAHAVSLKEALGWSVVWIALALAFNGALWWYAGPDKGIEFLTGYLIEKSLSLDNVFVFALLFGHFAVPPAYQHKVLFWGILGALLMRAAMIFAGAALIAHFAWIIYVFAAFLILTGVKMLVKGTVPPSPGRNPLVRAFSRIMPVTREFHGSRFFIRREGVLAATPLFIALLLVEFSDLVFAVDSIPAIFGVTSDPFIVYTSNVFAMLGLRSLYFALGAMIEKFHHLSKGLGLVLGFVGVKMLLAHTPWAIDTVASLLVVVVVIGGSMAASLVWPREGGAGHAAHLSGDAGP